MGIVAGILGRDLIVVGGLKQAWRPRRKVTIAGELVLGNLAIAVGVDIPVRICR
jgi:hypothetical protein